jgi:hypothetical protein
MTNRPILQQLHQLADEIRVQINLGSKEAKAAWQRLEPRLHDYERKAAKATDKIAEEVATAGKQLKKDLTKLLDDLAAA